MLMDKGKQIEKYAASQAFASQTLKSRIRDMKCKVSIGGYKLPTEG